MRWRGLVFSVAAACGLPGVTIAADASNGADVFDAACAECHSVSAAMKIKRGPSLFGVVGRQAGTQQGFEYSAGLLGSHLVWDAATLDRYITAPKSLVPDGAMKFDGLADPRNRADLIAFLAGQK